MAQTPNRLVILTALIAAAGCNTQSPGSLYEGPSFGQVGGFVTTVDNAPLAGVEVELQGLVAITDDSGMFVIDGVQPGDDMLVTFNAEGYGKTYTRTSVISWETAHVTKRMAEIDGVASFSALDGGEIQVGGVSIDFPADGIVIAATGERYTGEVSVEVTYIDPYTDELLAAPGDLTALAYGEGDSKAVSAPVNLVSYGMLGVELTTEEGEEAQLEEDAPAQVEIPVSQSGLASVYQMGAGDTQNSWHFDTESGVWTEVGEGDVFENEDGELVFGFEADSFSWWNCDQGFVPTCATGRVVDTLGFPVRGAQLEARGGQSTSVVTTDEQGYYVVSVLAGDTVTFTGSTFVARQSWQAAQSRFIDGEGSSSSTCEPIPEIQIEVCREAGVVMVENLELHVSGVDVAANGDQMRAWFYEPLGDPEMCRSPWDEIEQGECMRTTPQDFPTHLAADFPDGGDINTRSVGSFIDMSTGRDRYRMDMNTERDGKPRYFFETLEINDSDELVVNDIDIRGGDNLDVRVPGNPSDYWGALMASNWLQVPEDVTLSNLSGPQSQQRNASMDIRYDAKGSDYGMLVWAVQGADKDCLVCRFADNGNISLGANQMGQLTEDFASISVYRPEFTHVAGPDGLPIRQQVLSGAIVEAELR